MEFIFPGLLCGLQPSDNGQENLLFSLTFQLVARDEVDQLGLADRQKLFAGNHLAIMQVGT